MTRRERVAATALALCAGLTTLAAAVRFGVLVQSELMVSGSTVPASSSAALAWLSHGLGLIDAATDFPYQSFGLAGLIILTSVLLIGLDHSAGRVVGVIGLVFGALAAVSYPLTSSLPRADNFAGFVVMGGVSIGSPFIGLAVGAAGLAVAVRAFRGGTA